MKFYDCIMISGLVIAILIMIWIQLAGGKKDYGQFNESSNLKKELYVIMTKNCGSWRNSGLVFSAIDYSLSIYAVLSSLVCVYIASSDIDIKSAESSIILYSILAILFTMLPPFIKLRNKAIGNRESFVEMKDALAKHSTGLIDDNTLLETYKRCEEKITKSCY